MKIVYNILLIAVIGVLSSTYIFTLSPMDYSDQFEIPEFKESIVRLKSAQGTDLTDPDSVIIMHVADSENDITLESDNLFVADIFKDGEKILSNIKDLESVSIHFTDNTAHISNTSPMRTTIDISQNKLGLDYGSYTIVIASTIKEIKEENKLLTLNVTYTDNAIYKPATNTAPDDKAGITLYFTDENNNDINSLIPVTRFVENDIPLHEKLIKELQAGPLSDNMDKTIGDIIYTLYKDEYIYINLPSTDTTYTDDPIKSKIAYHSLLKSMFSLEKYYDLARIRFNVDGQRIETFFNGINIKHSIPYNNNFKAYLGYKLKDRYYLTDFDVNDINEDDSLELKIDKMFNFIKNSKTPNIKETIPEDVMLQDSLYSNGTLTLDFNEAFTNSFGKRNDLKLMMIDSIVYSFTTIKMVDSIIITVNGVTLETFAEGIDISGPLYPANFINPE